MHTNQSTPPRNNAPRWAQTLLRWWGHPDTKEEVQGDLLELYHYWVQTVGKRRANWRYVLSALKLLRPLARPKRTNYHSTPFFLGPAMLRNYVKIAFRQLWRSKGYAAINVVGLAAAFCIGVFLFLTAYLQLTFDSFHADGDRIFQTYFFSNDPEKPTKGGGMPFPLAPALKADFPELEAVTRVVTGRKSLVEVNGKYFDKLINFTDPDFLTVFSFPLLSGNRQTCL